MTEFVEFRKVHRLFREITITEKIDGTNAAIVIEPGSPSDSQYGYVGASRLDATFYKVAVQSRKKIITMDSDNFGFAKWVGNNVDSLVADLGPGLHYGEWWGSGIQRGYGFTKGEKFFAPFNSSRWAEHKFITPNVATAPVLWEGTFSERAIRDTVERLRLEGSVAAPGFLNPEGVVVFHHPANMMFKVTLEGDDANKWQLKKKG